MNKPVLTLEGMRSYFLAMPDTGGRQKRGSAWRLSNAHELGQHVMIRCGHCNIKRWYEPDDLRKLFGDVDVDSISGNMVCERCGLRAYISTETHHLSAKERAGIRVRRLAEIRMVRRVIWRDGD